MAWKRAATKTLLPVLLYSQTIKTRCATMPGDLFGQEHLKRRKRSGQPERKRKRENQDKERAW
jgi:hypothetical protein